ncbi:MAG TPA: glycosyltransferase family 2 protein, partial [Arthrobacter sp.]|nr:glycosyltransferase family 2 protein [Arthrobacter sp.]
LLGRRGRTVWWTLLPSLALFVPFLASTPDRPRALLADPGLPLGFDAAPLWQQALGQPLRFAADGGLTGLPVFGADTVVPWALLLALLIGLPVLLLAAAALFLPGRPPRTARALWATALLLLAGGWLSSQVATGVNANVLVTPFTGPAVSAAAFAVLAAALIGAAGLLDSADRASAAAVGRRVLLRTTAVTAVILLLAGPLAGLTAWAAHNILQPGAPSAPSAAGPVTETAGPAAAGTDPAGPDAAGTGSLGARKLVQPVEARTLPATAIDRGEGPEQSRTLVIATGDSGTFDAALMRGSGTTLDALSTIAAARPVLGGPGQETVRDDDAVVASLRSVVATIVAGQGVDPRTELERLGVGFVVLRAADTAAQLTASRMDAVPGLVAVGRTDVGWLWRISPLNQPAIQAADVAHRVRIVDGAGATVGLVPSQPVSADAAVPAGPDGRLVVLAERADPGWSAWLDGRRLTATASGWAQAFTLPAGGGQLSLRYEAPWAVWAGAAQAVIIGLTVLLAIPMPARRPNTGLSRDEGSLRKEHQNA